MPEGDTVWRTAQRLHQALAGQVLLRSDLRWPELSTYDFSGVSTIEVISRGKHLLHRLASGWTIHSHLRMEGRWRIERTQWNSSSDPIRAVLVAPEYTAVGLRLGMLDVVRSSEEHSLVGHLGPDLLGPDWDLNLAVHNVQSDPRPIGNALLDQRNLAGIGTLWAAESLFAEGLSPWLPASELPPERLRALIVRAQRFLVINKAHAVQSSTGERQAGRTSYVHGRAGRACRRCGTPVGVEPIGEAPQQRVMFFCPTCQPPPTM
ncbi:MAG: DNA-formamidopyrimidine glycosylase family protein [Micropruina sp.]